MSVPIPVVGYGVLMLAVAWQAGLAFLFASILFGALPLAALLAHYSEELGRVVGVVPKRMLDEAERAVRRKDREAFRPEDGGESLNWLNVTVEQMWPHIAKWGENLILGLEEAIQNNVKIPGGIRFKKCSLGSEPIRFGRIRPRVVPSYYGDEYLPEGGVELQIEVTYHSDVQLMLGTKFGNVGLASLEITGTLSVFFAPLLSQAPFFGGVQVLFTNPPKVNLDFLGLGNLADMPGIYSKVRNLIDDAIAGAIVTPRRIASVIVDDPKVDLARLRSPAPEGVLSIRVIRAEHLEGKDLAIVGSATSDPYVVLKASGETLKTPTVMKTCNPEWKEENTFDVVIYSVEQTVQIDVFDWDRIGADDHLGSISSCTVNHFISYSCKGPTPFRLYARNENEAPPPEDAVLYLDVTWLSLRKLGTSPPSSTPGGGKEAEQEERRDEESRPAEAASHCQFLLAFKIDEITGLPEKGLGGPFTLRLSLKGSIGAASGATRQSRQGWSKWRNWATERTLDNIRLLYEHGCDSAVIASVVDVGVDVIEEFVRDGAPTDTSQKKWVAKLQTSSHELESNRNPQFEEELVLKLKDQKVTAIVELLSDPKKRGKNKVSSNEVVARFEVELGDDEVVNGPWELEPPDSAISPTLSGGASGSTASLLAELGCPPLAHGTFTMWRLEETMGKELSTKTSPSIRSQASQRRPPGRSGSRTWMPTGSPTMAAAAVVRGGGALASTAASAMGLGRKSPTSADAQSVGASAAAGHSGGGGVLSSVSAAGGAVVGSMSRVLSFGRRTNSGSSSPGSSPTQAQRQTSAPLASAPPPSSASMSTAPALPGAKGRAEAPAPPTSTMPMPELSSVKGHGEATLEPMVSQRSGGSGGAHQATLEPMASQRSGGSGHDSAGAGAGGEI